MDKTFRAYSLDQRLLVPPDLREWLPDDDVALGFSNVFEERELSAIYAAYAQDDRRGPLPYHPAMMVKPLP